MTVQRALSALLFISMFLLPVNASPAFGQEAEKSLRIEVVMLDIRPDLNADIESLAKDNRRLQAAIRDGLARTIAIAEVAARRGKPTQLRLNQRVPLSPNQPGDQQGRQSDTSLAMSFLPNALAAERFEIGMSLELSAVIRRPNGPPLNVSRSMSNTVVVRLAEPVVAINVVNGDALIPSSTQVSEGWGNFAVILTVRLAE
jgi:hypothetical protein